MADPTPNLPWDPHQRPATLLEQRDGCYHLDNIRWGYAEAPRLEDWVGRFSDAFVDARDVSEVYITIVPFPPQWLAAHSFLVFVLPPDQPVRNHEGDHDRGLCLSVEAREHFGERFNIFQGLKKYYKIHYQLGTWRDEVQHTCRWQGKKIVRYRLQLDASQRRALLEKAIAEACRDHADEYYQSVNNSCFSNVVRLLNEVVPPRQRVQEWLLPGLLRTFSAANPVTGDLLLYRHRLAEHTGHILTQPDRLMWPEEQSHQTWVGAVVEQATETLPLRPLFWAAAAALGLRRRTRWRWVQAAVLGYIFDHVHDLLLVRSHTRYEPCEPYLYEGKEIDGDTRTA